MHDNKYMQRCLDLALSGAGYISPNPMVGCVIVYEDKIIGEGCHEQYGGPHAEVNAINNVLHKYGEKAGKMLARATVYVSLEPCSHFGKTPPCADLLIKHRIKKVVIGNRDPFPEVDGKGIEKLKAAGIEVIDGILQDECAFINRRFFTRVTKQRPYIILKWAQTSNGFFAPANGTKQWITGNEARILVHKWRAEEDAILVGKNTVQADDPELTVRYWKGKNPVRILIDKNLSVNPALKIFNTAAPTLVLNEIHTAKAGNVQYIQMEDMQFYLPEKIMYQLYLLDIQSVIVEGGAHILNQFIDSGLWDEARIFTSPTEWTEGLPAPFLKILPEEKLNIGADKLNIYYNKNDLYSFKYLL